jgi:hypothetical protein
MLKFSHRTLIAIAGALWFVVGFALLGVGLRLIVGVAKASLDETPALFLPHLAPHLGNREVAAVCTIALCLVVGYLKSRFVLVKSVKRVVRRILTLPNPASLSRLYTLSYYLLIAAMMGIGMLFKVLQIPADLRGAIDVAVGAALLNGALLYFRYANNSTPENFSA